MSTEDNKQRCFWVNMNNPLYVKYHDEEWGVPVYEDQKLFEMLILEGAQAGLSWETVLNKRENYRRAFHGFDPVLVSQMSDDALEALLQDKGLIRNRLKIYSVRKNAVAFLEIQKEFGSFKDYIWAYVDHTPIINRPQKPADVPAKTELSDRISKDLKKRGMSFVGSTIIYAYMQAAGLVNDHMADCFCLKN